MAVPISVASLKLTLVYAGVLLFAAVIMSFSAPLILNLAVHHVPVIYDNVVFFLKPPYLYLLINCIIISIVASSKLQQNSPEAETQPLPDVANHVQTDFVSEYKCFVENKVVDDRVVENELSKTKFKSEMDNEMEMERDDCSAKTMKPPERIDSMEFLFIKNNKKPLVSSRFGQRKAVEASLEGVNKAAALRVSKPRRQDTLETTWKKITEGRSVPLKRQLKKSGTWENSHVRDSGAGCTENKRMTKSETFNDRITTGADPGDDTGRQKTPAGRMIRREPSLSQEELNRRVEAFIDKFNEEMRLQRQESLTQYHKTMMKTDELAA